MPSPFPGMDPWLEHPALWPDVHQSLITYARDALQERLGGSFYLSMGERVYIEKVDRDFYPDVAIVEPPGKRPPSGAATLVVDAPERLHLRDVERREVYLELKDARRGHRILTVIEVLSPSNKRPGPGRDLYLRKQADVLASDANLVEIDLLRGGERTIALPREIPLGTPYAVLVSRSPDRTHLELYRSGLRERLPRVAIPVTEGEPDLPLDLPALMAQAYERGAYSRRLDYTQPPVPPLEAGDAAWTRERLTARS